MVWRGRRGGAGWLAAGALLTLSAGMGLYAQETRQAPPRDPIEMLRQQTARQEQAATAPDTAPAGPNLLEGPQRPNGLVPPFIGLIDPERQAQLAEDLTDDQVLASINKGVDALLKLLAEPIAPVESRGRFRNDTHQVGQVGAAVYALLQVGRSTNDARLRFSSKELKPAVDWLLKAQTTRTYEAAFQAGALSLLPPRPEFRLALNRVKQQIVNAIQPNGAYGYEVADAITHIVPQGRGPGFMMNGPDVAWWDNSNTQYALLGVWSAAEADADVDPRFWRLSDGHWRTDQLPNGGWGYNTISYPNPMRNNPLQNEISAARETMTLAGVASLYVTTDRIGIPATLDPVPDKALEAGLARVAQDYRIHVPILAQDLYYLYGLERVGLASGRRYFDNNDWFRQGAAGLILSQSDSGSWVYGGPYIAFMPMISTSYALLFLAHGRNPIAFNKLQYSGPWDARPRDAADLTRWLGKQLERPLNWEIAELEAPLRDWMDAPVLLLTGHGDPQFKPAEIAKFRDYIQAGGLIFSSADGDDPIFTKAITGVMAQTLDRRFEPRSLPADHPIYHLEFKVPTRTPLVGLSNGLREVWIHSPQDMGAFWQTHNAAKPEYFQIPGNVYLYAIGQTNNFSRLQSVLVPPAAAEPTRKIDLGRLRYSGNWDPEPGAWPRLAALLRYDKINLNLQTLDLANLDATRLPLVHMTGSTKFTLTPDSQAIVKKFLESGGTLLVDAADASDAFIASFTALLAELYPDNRLELVDPAGVVFDGSVPGSAKIDSVDYRPTNRRPSWSHVPELVGLKLKDRWAVLFSQPDITSGLLGTNTWGIAGYKSPSAIAVAKNLILFGAGRPAQDNTAP